MVEILWGNGHYSCCGCCYYADRNNDKCKRCLTYTPLMQPYYRNWTKKEEQLKTNETNEQTHDAEIRAKVIDEFAKAVNDFLHREDISYYSEDIKKIAEQLKGGVTVCE